MGIDNGFFIKIRFCSLLKSECQVKIPDFGLADAIILASARSRKIKVLTGDPHFKNFKDAVML